MRIALWTAVVTASLSAGLATAQEACPPGRPSPAGPPAWSHGLLHHHGYYPWPGHRYMWHCHGNKNSLWRAQFKPWNGPYYDVSYGTPVAMVTPPNAERQTNYGWGVGNTRVSRIDHQFLPFAPYGPSLGLPLLPTPPWPSDTAQFGDYYVRAPW